MIEYINISKKDYENLYEKERKEKLYCIVYSNGELEYKVKGNFHQLQP